MCTNKYYHIYYTICVAEQFGPRYAALFIHQQSEVKMKQDETVRSLLRMPSKNKSRFVWRRGRTPPRIKIQDLFVWDVWAFEHTKLLYLIIIRWICDIKCVKSLQTSANKNRWPVGGCRHFSRVSGFPFSCPNLYTRRKKHPTRAQLIKKKTPRTSPNSSASSAMFKGPWRYSFQPQTFLRWWMCQQFWRTNAFEKETPLGVRASGGMREKGPGSAHSDGPT